MPHQEHIEPEDTETTPLIFSPSQRRSLTKHKKAGRFARVLGRVFNPINDAVVGGIAVKGIYQFYATYKLAYLSGRSNEIIETYLSYGQGLYVLSSVISIINVSSIAFELVNSYQLSKSSRFILGNNYYEHSRTLVQELNAELSAQEMYHGHQDFERWITEIKRSPHKDHIIKLITDFKTVNRYNRIRSVIDSFTVLILGVYTLSFLAANSITSITEYEGGVIDNVSANLILLNSATAATLIMGIIFAIKIYIDGIEHNWSKYENRWKNLPIRYRKTALFFRTLIDGLYHFLTVQSIYTLLLTDTPNLNLLQIKWPTYLSYTSIPILFTAIQLIPGHLCCTRSQALQNIKRGGNGITQGTKTGACAFWLSSVIIYVFLQFKAPVLGSNVLSVILYFVLPSIIGIVTMVNTIMNYQEPDPNKMSTVDHDASKLREEIVVIKEGLLKDAGKLGDSNIGAQMDNKSEIDPIPKNALLENTQESNQRSFLSSICCFWGRSNTSSDAASSESPSSLREAINF